MKLKIDLPPESLVHGHIFLEDYGSIEFRGYYSDYIKILENMKELYGVVSIRIAVDYTEHL